MNKIILAVALIAVVAFVVWYANAVLAPNYAFRLHVEVDTADGVKSGSSVIAVKAGVHTGAWMLPEAQGFRASVRGEAVFVDLGRGRNLIAILAHGETAAGCRSIREDGTACLRSGRKAR